MIATARRAPVRARPQLAPRRVALVSCSGPKLPFKSKARALYTSPLFKFARAYAELTCDAWAILSAQHGLVLPDAEVAPYDLRLERLTREQRDAWCSWVRHVAFASFPGATFVLLAGAHYTAAFDGHAAVERPLFGLSIGERLHWLKREILKAKRPGATCPTCQGDGLLPLTSEVCPKCAGAAVRL